jgi:hypothetical protein
MGGIEMTWAILAIAALVGLGASVARRRGDRVPVSPFQPISTVHLGHRRTTMKHRAALRAASELLK